MEEGENHPPKRTDGVDESSLVETTRIDPDDNQLDSMTEEDRVREHLQDVESSFIAPASPTIPVGGPDAGVDDTYLFDAVAKKPSATTTTTTTMPTVHESPGADLSAQPDEAADNSELPSSLPDNPHAEADTTESTSALESLSSPTAAAVARNASRGGAVDPKSADQDAPGQDENTDLSTHDTTSGQTPHDTSASSISRPDQPEDSSEADSKRLSVDADSSGQMLNVNKRPKYLRSRNTSQRSSTSSFLASDDGSNVTVSMGGGADYALQSGGAIPSYGLSRSASNSLNRSISLGSMMSGFDDSLEFDPQNALEPLEEMESPVRSQQQDILATPKAQKGSLVAPTDTIIARHVRDVQVPESLAKVYKNKGGLSTPLQSQRKVSEAPGTAARTGKNMTLKEQSSTIERLSKENFDLKLKVMFLDDRLRRTSEEGMQEMIAENVESRIALVVIQKENKSLRRKVKELEERLGDQDARPTTARSGFSSEGRATPTAGAHQSEEEVIILRERVEEYTREIERLREDKVANEFEKRKLAETIRTMGERQNERQNERAGERAGESVGKQEETDMWKDLLDQEVARSHQMVQDIKNLRDENFRLKQEMSGAGSNGGALHHTTNIYNITRKPRQTSPSRSRPVSGLSGEVDPSSSFSQSSTLVEELRRESEQLRHENTELRKDLGAQTSMLTSRNREKERLYQEIEDLKMAQRRGGQAPSTLDSLLDRSASRAGARDRPISRGSGQSRLTVTMEDPEREDLENKIAEQRDKINELKFHNQDLQKALDTANNDVLSTDDARQAAENTAADLEEELNNATNDMVAMQRERDDALEDQEATEARLTELQQEFNDLQQEFQGNIDDLDAEIIAKEEEIQRLQIDLREQSENFEALQTEMRGLTDSLIGLEDEHARTHKRIEQLKQELVESSRELEDLENQLLESNEKVQRLSIQQESSQGEIAFLREEQEGDKVRIGDLEAALANAEQTIRDEHERAREFEQRLANERKQREMIANREKEEVQQVVNDLNKEASTAKEELRVMRKSLTNREVEATKWKERLTELESNLREALGDLNGTRSSFLQSIAKLQQELETTVHELDTTKSSLLEKDRIIKQRDNLLETHGLESKRLSEMLDKERQGHRNTKNQFETFQRTHQHVSRTVTSQDTRIVELETSRATDKKKIAQLETMYKEQLAESNNLLLILWTRLSSLCGSDWAHNNSLINGRALPSLESISTMLPGFSKNILAAVKAVESMLGNFQNRIKKVERELWKEYQVLENNLDQRTKKLDRLETLVRSGVAAGSLDAQRRLSHLETENRTLKIENATLHRARDARNRSAGYAERGLAMHSDRNGSHEELIETGSPSPHVPTGPHGRESRLPRSKTTHLETTTTSRSGTSTVTRSSSKSGAGDLERASTSHGEGGSARGGDDTVLLLRLREIEQKLKQEREARQLDRAAARQRIQDSERQTNELAAELVRAKRRGGE